jgi:hypothetical protein
MNNSSEQDQVRLLAERVARRVSQANDKEPRTNVVSNGGSNVGNELASLRETLGEVQKRLSQIESHITDESPSQSASVSSGSAARRQESFNERGQNQNLSSVPPATRSPWLSGVYFPATHPSMEKFGVDEAAVSELVDFFEKEKTCSLEPGDKPCDHCAMCSSRGF